jgi:hypothetical protein
MIVSFYPCSFFLIVWMKKRITTAPRMQSERKYTFQIALYKRKASALYESSYYRRYRIHSRLNREPKSWRESIGEWMDGIGSNAPLSLWLFKDELIQRILTGQRDNSMMSFLRGCMISMWMLVLYVLNIVYPSEWLMEKFDEMTIYSHVELIITDGKQFMSYTATQTGVRRINSRTLSSPGYNLFYNVYLTKDGLENMIRFLDAQVDRAAPFDANGYTFYYLPYPFLVIYKWFSGGNLFPVRPSAFTCSSLVAFALICGGFLSPTFDHVMSGYEIREKGDGSRERVYIMNPYITSPQLLEYLLYDAHRAGDRVALSFNQAAIQPWAMYKNNSQ